MGRCRRRSASTSHTAPRASGWSGRHRPCFERGTHVTSPPRLASLARGRELREGRAAWLAVLLVPLLYAAIDGSRPRFYPDDPIAREPENEDASGAGEADIGLFYE